MQPDLLAAAGAVAALGLATVAQLPEPVTGCRRRSFWWVIVAAGAVFAVTASRGRARGADTAGRRGMGRHRRRAVVARVGLLRALLLGSPRTPTVYESLGSAAVVRLGPLLWAACSAILRRPRRRRRCRGRQPDLAGPVAKPAAGPPSRRRRLMLSVYRCSSSLAPRPVRRARRGSAAYYRRRGRPSRLGDVAADGRGSIAEPLRKRLVLHLERLLLAAGRRHEGARRGLSLQARVLGAVVRLADPRRGRLDRVPPLRPSDGLVDGDAGCAARASCSSSRAR